VAANLVQGSVSADDGDLSVSHPRSLSGPCREREYEQYSCTRGERAPREHRPARPAPPAASVRRFVRLVPRHAQQLRLSVDYGKHAPAKAFGRALWRHRGGQGVDDRLQPGDLGLTYRTGGEMFAVELWLIQRPENVRSGVL
jgi:hypothetical protein